MPPGTLAYMTADIDLRQRAIVVTGASRGIGEAIALACAEKIPIPPVKAENIESIIVDGQPATLYHDTNSDSSPRDEVIVKHPSRDEEVIIAGYGNNFQQALASFKFVE